MSTMELNTLLNLLDNAMRTEVAIVTREDVTDNDRLWWRRDLVIDMSRLQAFLRIHNIHSVLRHTTLTIV